MNEQNGSIKRVGLAGFGTVGRSVARILTGQRHGRLELARICTRSVERRRAAWVPAEVGWTEDFADLLTPDIDIVVEVIGGLEPAGDWIRRAFEAGKSVVTANKQLVAESGDELRALAASAGQAFRFEAAVAGGVPVIRAIQDGLAGDRLTRIVGILNGTCNYVLTRMEGAGLSFGRALREAQEQGFAEADPTADIQGLDARAKLAILCGVALGRPVRPSLIPAHSIAGVGSADLACARALGYAIRQVSLAAASPGAGAPLRARVGPALVPLGSPLAAIRGAQNIVVVTGDYGGETVFSGQGAGGDPTAVAVVSDLLAVADRTRAERGSRPTRAAWSQVETEDEAPHYARFTLRPRAGVVACVEGILASHGVVLEGAPAEPEENRSPRVVAFRLAPARPSRLAAALGDRRLTELQLEPPACLPIVEADRRLPESAPAWAPRPASLAAWHPNLESTEKGFHDHA